MWNSDCSIIKPCSVVLEPLTPEKQLALSTELKRAISEKNMLTTRTRKKVIEALDELDELGPTTTKGKKKMQAIQEILDSEVSYLKQLEIIKKFFMEPVKARGLLRNDDYRTLFGSIDSIYNVNGELLNELKRNMFNVATAFKNLAPYFKMYSIYAYDYKNSIYILQREEKEGSSFGKFVKAQETRPEVQSKLSALLISPIQRIPRYQLLLKQVLENSTPEDEDYSILVSSYRRIEEVAHHINSLVEDHENTEKMLAFQRCLLNQKPNLVKPGRRVLKSGTLTKLSTNGRHLDRYCVLMNDIIMFCKMKGGDVTLPNSLKCSSILPLSECQVTEVLSRGCFKINCQDEEIVAYHRSIREGTAWVQELKDAIAKYHQNRKTLQRDDSQRKPAKRKGVFEYEEPGVSPGRPLKRRATDDVTDTMSLPCSRRKPSSVDFALSSVNDRPQSRHKFPERRSSVSTRWKPSLCLSEDVSQSILSKNVTTTLESSGSNISSTTTTDVYVFGSGQKRGFTFGLGTIFRGIRNSVRSIFGFQ